MALRAQNSSVCGSRLIIHNGGCGRCAGCTEISRVVGVKLLAVERKRLRLAEGRAHVLDEFERRRLPCAIVETEGPEEMRIDAGNEAELHAAAEHLIDNRDLFGEPQRMIKRHNVPHRSDAQTPGARAGGNRVQAWRRHPAFVGTKMMLDAKGVVEPDLVAHCKLAPELLIALMRRHAGLRPNVGKMRKLHRIKTILPERSRVIG